MYGDVPYLVNTLVKCAAIRNFDTGSKMHVVTMALEELKYFIGGCSTGAVPYHISTKQQLKYFPITMCNYRVLPVVLQCTVFRLQVEDGGALV